MSNCVGPTKTLASFIKGLSFEKIPAEVKEKAKTCVLDTICCGLFGSVRPEGIAVLSSIKEITNSTFRTASVWGTGYKTDYSYAALANGVMVESFTMDDLHNRSILHPGSVTVPTATSVADWLGGISGKDFLTAVVAGYETAIRVGLGVSPSTRVRGHHPVGICGPFGAAAVACKLLGLSEGQIQSALGNAGSQGAGLMSAQFGYMTQRLHSGKANQSGIIAAMLAKSGFTGTSNVLEAEYGGFCRTFADTCNLESIVENLGHFYETQNVGLRPYACAGSVCTTVDAVKLLREKHSIKPSEVASITVTCNESIALHCGWEYKPDTIITAQMNIPYGAAVTLLEGNAAVLQYTEEKIKDPGVLEMVSRVRVIHDPRLDSLGQSHAYYVKVEIATTQGQVFNTEVHWAKGTPSNPMSEQELADKCHMLADGVIGPRNVDSLIDLVLNIEDVGEVSQMLRLL